MVFSRFFAIFAYCPRCQKNFKKYSQKTPRKPPRRAKTFPRSTQDAPRSPQDTPKTQLRPSEMHSRRAQDAARLLQIAHNPQTCLPDLSKARFFNVWEIQNCNLGKVFVSIVFQVAVSASFGQKCFKSTVFAHSNSLHILKCDKLPF